MTRFDADTPETRRELYADAIAAHRSRGSEFLTLEVDPDEPLDQELGVPWIQISDDTINVDCTDAELERLKSTLEQYQAFEIAELTRLEDADGINLRVSAHADRDRIAQFIDSVFRQVYELPEEFRVWAVSV